PGPSRINAVAENGGLDRLMVSSRRDDLDFAWRGWEIGIEGEQIYPAAGGAHSGVLGRRWCPRKT
ncbi:MAG: hypothetical protein WBW59_23630, partial [Pseudolabrys sp.]